MTRISTGEKSIPIKGMCKLCFKRFSFPGNRNNNGTFNNATNNGNYWSTTPNSTNAYNLNVNSGNANTNNNNNRANGFTVRCLKDYNVVIDLCIIPKTLGQQCYC